MICPYCQAITATPAVGGEPIAWSYELATARYPDTGMYANFQRRLSWDEPVCVEGSIRNLTPLYAAQPASPLPSVGGEARKWIIDLIHNEYDPKPSDYRPSDNWNDGAEEIADKIVGCLAPLASPVMGRQAPYVDPDFDQAGNRRYWEQRNAREASASPPKQPLRWMESVRQIAHRHCTCTCRGDPEVLQNHTNLCDSISDAILEYAHTAKDPSE